jgi:hypothetical protein
MLTSGIVVAISTGCTMPFLMPAHYSMSFIYPFKDSVFPTILTKKPLLSHSYSPFFEINFLLLQHVLVLFLVDGDVLGVMVVLINVLARVMLILIELIRRYLKRIQSLSEIMLLISYLRHAEHSQRE